MNKFLVIAFIVLCSFSINSYGYTIPNDTGFSSQLYLENPSAELKPGVDVYDINYTDFFNFVKTDRRIKDLTLTNKSKPILVVVSTDFNLNNNDLDYSKIYKIDKKYVLDLFNQKTDKDYFKDDTSVDFALAELISKTNNRIGFSGLLLLDTPVILFDIRQPNQQNLLEAFEKINKLKNDGINIRAVLSLISLPESSNLENISKSIQTLGSNGIAVVAPVEVNMDSNTNDGLNSLCSLKLLNLLCVLDVNKIINTTNKDSSIVKNTTSIRSNLRTSNRIERRENRQNARANSINRRDNRIENDSIQTDRRLGRREIGAIRGISRSINRGNRDGGLLGGLGGTGNNEGSNINNHVEDDSSSTGGLFGNRNRGENDNLDQQEEDVSAEDSSTGGGLFSGLFGNENNSNTNQSTDKTEELINYADFVIGGKFDTLESSVVSATALAGIYVNTVYLYPELIRKDLQEVYNVFNIINFIRSSSLAIEYEKTVIASDGTVMSASNLENYEQHLEEERRYQEGTENNRNDTGQVTTSGSRGNSNSGIFGGLFGRNENSVKDTSQLFSGSQKTVMRVYLPKLIMTTVDLPIQGNFNQNFISNLMNFPLYYNQGTFTDIPLIGAIISQTVFPLIVPGIIHNNEFKNITLATPNMITLFFNRTDTSGPAINMYVTPDGQLVESIDDLPKQDIPNNNYTENDNNRDRNRETPTTEDNRNNQPIYHIVIEGDIVGSVDINQE